MTVTEQPIKWVAARCTARALGCGPCIRYAGHLGQHSCSHYTKPSDGAIHPDAAFEMKLAARRQEIRFAAVG